MQTTFNHPHQRLIDLAIATILIGIAVVAIALLAPIVTPIIATAFTTAIGYAATAAIFTVKAVTVVGGIVGIAQGIL